MSRIVQAQNGKAKPAVQECCYVQFRTHNAVDCLTITKSGATSITFSEGESETSPSGLSLQQDASTAKRLELVGFDFKSQRAAGTY